MSKPDGKGLRYNEGKNQLDLVPAYAYKQLGRVFTKGAEKYARDNWRKGMSWRTVMGSLERHYMEFKEGKDFDEETGLPHIAQVAWNALVLTEYMKIYPHGDDRAVLPPRKIALDVDGVLANFGKAFKERCEIEGVAEYMHNWDEQPYWHHPYNTGEVWGKVKEDYDFWFNIEPLVNPVEMPFEPVAYVTHRFIDVTTDWIQANGFPCAPVYTVHPTETKVNILKEIGADIFVDDKYQNFQEVNDAQRRGELDTICYLYDAPHNRKFDVGYRRIKSLDELV